MIKYNICQKDYQSIQKIDLLPDDCLRIIYDFLTHKDKHMTYYKYYNDILNIRLTCKKFYFGIPFNYTSAKNNLLEECNERICKSWCKDIYNLDEYDISHLEYTVRRSHNHYYVHLYKLTEIKDTAYYKYGSEYEYNKWKDRLAHIKTLNKKEKTKILTQRKETYNKLFEKYKTDNKYNLERIYAENLTYLKKELPRLCNIEKSIIYHIESINRESSVMDYLANHSIEYLPTPDINEYIKYDSHSFDTAVDSVIQIHKKREKNILEITSVGHNIADFKTIIDKDNDYIKEIIFFKKYSQVFFNNEYSIEELSNKYNIILNIYVKNWAHRNTDLSIIDFKDEIPYEIMKLINNFHNNVKNRKAKNMCSCGAAGSPKCIEILCKKCCTEKSCKRHGFIMDKNPNLDSYI